MSRTADLLSRVGIRALVAAAVPVLALAAYLHAQDRRPSAGPRPSTAGQRLPPSAPTLAGGGQRTFDVLAGRLRVGVTGLAPSQPSGRFALDAERGAPPLRRPDTVALAVTGRLEGGRPRTHYRLEAGDCVTGRKLREPWALGTADARGNAVLRGGPVRVTKAHSYYVELHPWPFRHRPGAIIGLAGFFASGKAEPFRQGQSPCLQDD